MSADTTSSNLKQWSQNQEFDKIASFFTSLTGSTHEARSLLQNVVDSLSDNNTSRKRQAPPPTPPSVSTPFDHRSFLVQDALDEATVTSLIQIPNDKAVIGTIIGPQGKNIKVSEVDLSLPFSFSLSL